MLATEVTVIWAAEEAASAETARVPAAAVPETAPVYPDIVSAYCSQISL